MGKPKAERSESDVRDLESFGAAFREARLEAGLTQAQLASQMDLNRTYIAQVERGEVNLSFTNILRFARALGLSPGAVMPEK